MYYLFSKINCGYCTKAKQLLQMKQTEFIEMKIPENRELLDKMILKFNAPTPKSVPQIFTEDQYIGGFNDLVEVLNSFSD